MRVKVTLQNILEYGLDTITGNTRGDLLARAAAMEADGYEMFVNIPDVEGGDKEVPQERNIFKHYSSDLPDPEGNVHALNSFDLRDQLYVQNPCTYQRHVIVESRDVQWICSIHHLPSKHSVEEDSHAPCLAMDPYYDSDGE